MLAAADALADEEPESAKVGAPRTLAKMLVFCAL